MLNALLFVFLLVVAGWIFISPVVYIYWALKPSERLTRLTQESRLSYVIFPSALLGFGIFFAAGFDFASFAIGRLRAAASEHGHFVHPHVHAPGPVSILLSGLASFFVLWLIIRVGELTVENHDLHKQLDSMKHP